MNIKTLSLFLLLSFISKIDANARAFLKAYNKAIDRLEKLQDAKIKAQSMPETYKNINTNKITIKNNKASISNLQKAITENENKQKKYGQTLENNINELNKIATLARSIWSSTTDMPDFLRYQTIQSLFTKHTPNKAELENAKEKYIIHTTYLQKKPEKTSAENALLRKLQTGLIHFTTGIRTLQANETLNTHLQKIEQNIALAKEKIVALQSETTNLENASNSLQKINKYTKELKKLYRNINKSKNVESFDIMDFPEEIEFLQEKIRILKNKMKR